MVQTVGNLFYVQIVDIGCDKFVGVDVRRRRNFHWLHRKWPSGDWRGQWPELRGRKILSFPRSWCILMTRRREPYIRARGDKKLLKDARGIALSTGLVFAILTAAGEWERSRVHKLHPTRVKRYANNRWLWTRHVHEFQLHRKLIERHLCLDSCFLVSRIVST